MAIEGCDPNFLSLPPEETFHRAFGHAEFDVCELSTSSYLIQHDRGKADYVALPVFTLRKFRHGAIYVRDDAGIERPEDLRGRLVGIPEYQVTAVMWVRGFLADDHGVEPREIRWRTGGVIQAGRTEKLRLDLPGDVEVQPIDPARTLADMLHAGELDAVIAPRPVPFEGAHGRRVRRLFADHEAVEREWWARTRLHPIMHLIGVRRSLAEAQPWLSASLFKAFAAAKDMAVARARAIAAGADAILMPWSDTFAQRGFAALGPDPWPYGVDANRHALETVTRYSHAQGLTSRRLGVDELFAPPTLKTFRI